MSGEEDSNYELFKEAVSQRLIQKLAPVPVKPSTGRSKRRQKRQISRQGDATDLASSREVSSAVHSDGENAGDEAGDNDNEGDDRLEEFVEVSAFYPTPGKPGRRQCTAGTMQEKVGEETRLKAAALANSI